MEGVIFGGKTNVQPDASSDDGGAEGDAGGEEGKEGKE